jgi:hypothetical protein
VGQGAAGAILTLAPETAARLAAGGESPPPGWLVRVLGGRMAVQAVVLSWVGRHHRAERGRAYRLGSVVDVLHGASMVGAAAAFPRYRRSAMLSAGMAFAAAGLERAVAR